MQVTMQKSMTYTFPLFTLFIGMKFASALAIYWTVFSLTQVYQQVSTQGWGSLTPWIDKLKVSKKANN
jgi:membrane protein insertase Oxa1/YidC/SpoIIIJ